MTKAETIQYGAVVRDISRESVVQSMREFNSFWHYCAYLSDEGVTCLGEYSEVPIEEITDEVFRALEKKFVELTIP